MVVQSRGFYSREELAPKITPADTIAKTPLLLSYINSGSYNS